MAATTVNTIMARKKADEAAAAANGPPIDRQAKQEAEAAAAKQRRADRDEAARDAAARLAAKHPIIRAFSAGLELVNGMTFQCLIYFAFVAVFQSLTGTMRGADCSALLLAPAGCTPLLTACRVDARSA